MRAVLDTNVLISGVITTGTSHRVLLRGFRGEFDLVISLEIIEEFRDTLTKYPGKFSMTLDDIQQEVDTVRYYSTIVMPNEDIDVIDADPSDNTIPRNTPVSQILTTLICSGVTPTIVRSR